jgi:hypothetical protein
MLASEASLGLDGRVLLWGTLAIGLHVSVALALPAAETKRAPPPAAVWMDLGCAAPTTGADKPTGTPHAGAFAAAPPPPARRAQLRPSQPRPATVARAEPTRARRAPEPSAPAAAASDPETTDAVAGAAQPTGAGAEHAARTGAGDGPSWSGAGGTLAAGEPVAHGPDLLAYGAPCAGYFPAKARASHGEVQLALDVDARGHAQASAVLAEQPGGQGFASAARACARRLIFAPAMTRSGAHVAGHARVKLRFDRR